MKPIAFLLFVAVLFSSCNSNDIGNSEDFGETTAAKTLDSLTYRMIAYLPNHPPDSSHMI